MTVLGWAAVVLTVLHTPGHALVHLSTRQVLLLLELFKYQRKAPVLNYLVFSPSETLAGLNNLMAASNQTSVKQVFRHFGKRNLSFCSEATGQMPSEACL